jgi:hypothetical protein
LVGAYANRLEGRSQLEKGGRIIERTVRERELRCRRHVCPEIAQRGCGCVSVRHLVVSDVHNLVEESVFEEACLDALR